MTLSIALTCHPATPCETVRRVEVQARRTGPDTLELEYVLEGDIDRLLIPTESPPRRADKLWQHTCFEAFVAAMETMGYHEFNFSPSTEWAVYQFSAYRVEMTAVTPTRPPGVSFRRGRNHLTLAASIDLGSFAELRSSGGLKLGLSAVIEDAEQRISYWALAHPAGKPDFHHADGFALKLPAHPDPNPRIEPGAGSPSEAGQGKGGGGNRR